MLGLHVDYQAQRFVSQRIKVVVNSRILRLGTRPYCLRYYGTSKTSKTPYGSNGSITPTEL